jgi:hypothetical protein
MSVYNSGSLCQFATKFTMFTAACNAAGKPIGTVAEQVVRN